MRRSVLSGCVLSLLAGAALAQDTDYNITLESVESIQGFARVDGMFFGGISGVDYDPQSKFWYAVSHDDGSHAPVRFFAMVLNFDKYGNLHIASDEVQKLNQPSGDLVPVGHHTPSGVRIIPPDPIGDEPYLIWSSEGVLDKGHKSGVFEMCTGATYMDGFQLPEYMSFVDNEQGPRVNMAFESIALLPNMNVIAGYEQPLAQDGPIAEAGGETVHTRLVRLDYFDAEPLGEMAYPLEAPSESFGEGAVRSLVDFVALDDDTLLAVENIEVPSDNRIREVTTELYLVELGGATDIRGTERLADLEAGADFTPVSKTFLADNESLGGLRKSPFRAVTFGPMFEDGRASILLVSDNDLDQYQSTYVALLSAQGLQPMRPFVKDGGKAYEARPITDEQGVPQRIRVLRQEREKRGEDQSTTLGAG